MYVTLLCIAKLAISGELNFVELGKQTCEKQELLITLVRRGSITVKIKTKLPQYNNLSGF